MSAPHPMDLVRGARRVVVKVGTGVLTAGGAQLNEARIQELADELVALRSAGRCVILVSSGAIGAGMGVLKWKQRPRDLARSQAAAAVGQGRLMQVYSAAFGRHGVRVGQILLTREDLVHRRRYLNARQTIRALLAGGVLPIVNENDTVSTEEIRFGDNDELSALVAHLTDADLLAVLTDVDGFERRARSGKREVVPVVERITPELERSAEGTRQPTAVGGMVTKLQAARTAAASGIAMLLANGARPGVLRAHLVDGHLSGTLFLPAGKGRMRARKRWLAFASRPKGTLRVDAGAREALKEKGRSLLASGVREVEGSFRKGDLVSVQEAGSGREFARGLTRYGHEELTKIRGMRSDAVAEALGRKAEEVIHRDSLVILEA